MTEADRGVLNDYKITHQAQAVILDSKGTIVERGSYSGADKWRGLFDTLLAN